MIFTATKNCSTKKISKEVVRCKIHWPKSSGLVADFWLASFLMALPRTADWLWTECCQNVDNNAKTRWFGNQCFRLETLILPLENLTFLQKLFSKYAPKIRWAPVPPVLRCLNMHCHQKVCIYFITQLGNFKPKILLWQCKWPTLPRPDDWGQCAVFQILWISRIANCCTWTNCLILF